MSKCRPLVLMLFFPVFIIQAQNEDALKPMIISGNEATRNMHGEAKSTHLSLGKYDNPEHKINESLESIWTYIEEGNPKAIQDANEILALSFNNGLPQPLSLREQGVLVMLLNGSSNQQIAEKLWISEHTVKTNLKNIFFKTDVQSRLELITKIYIENK